MTNLEHLNTWLNNCIAKINKEDLNKGNVLFKINDTFVPMKSVMGDNRLVIDEISIFPLTGLYHINFRELKK